VGSEKTDGCRIYTTDYPCFSCARIIKLAGIKKIYYMMERSEPDKGKKFIVENFQNEAKAEKIDINHIFY
jgi:deoxycytidylate deaminase